MERTDFDTVVSSIESRAVRGVRRNVEERHCLGRDLQDWECTALQKSPKFWRQGLKAEFIRTFKTICTKEGVEYSKAVRQSSLLKELLIGG